MFETLFKTREFEKKGNLYEKMGVKYTQAVVMGTVGKICRLRGMDDKASNYFIGDKRDLKSLQQYRKGTIINEIVHAVQIPVLLSLLTSDNLQMVGLGAGAIIFHSKLIILQRYNRGRVDKIIEYKNNKDIISNLD